MTEQLKNLLILLAAIVVVLILIILLFSGKSHFRRLLSLFLEEREDYEGGGREEEAVPAKQLTPTQRRRAAVEEAPQKRTSEPIVEMATLVRKSDDRLRVIESTGQVRLVDEYYELIFVTRKGQKLKIECSAEAYEKVPFNQQGSLTYKRNTLVKFKYYEDTVFN
ncbi:DUF2500 family protein [Ruminococcus flavefaciens]|uniref:DUF2500 family protein n=1 Tax=Ruminococcus flavefaciens TaxID=1265 RepID=UPI0004642D9B|nr:DUF2500 family protein [Ruminococcus flavefaciens]